MVLIYYSSFSLFYPHPFPASLYLMFSFFLFSSLFFFSPLIFTLFLPLLYHSSSHLSNLLFTILFIPFLSYFPFPSLSTLFFSFSFLFPLLFFQLFTLFFLVYHSFSHHLISFSSCSSSSSFSYFSFPQLSILSAVFLPLFSSSLVSTL